MIKPESNLKDSIRQFPINATLENNDDLISLFENSISKMKAAISWSKKEIIDLFNRMLPEFNHMETGKYLDSKM